MCTTVHTCTRIVCDVKSLITRRLQLGYVLYISQWRVAVGVNYPPTPLGAIWNLWIYHSTELTSYVGIHCLAKVCNHLAVIGSYCTYTSLEEWAQMEDYSVLCQIGKGACGAVFLARHQQSKKWVKACSLLRRVAKLSEVLIFCLNCQVVIPTNTD